MPFKRSIGNHTNSIQGSTRSVGKDGWRLGEDPMKFSNIPYHIYTQKTSWRDLRNPLLYIVIASYGMATATPVARIILLCTCCHCMGFVVVHSWPERQLSRLPSIVETGSW